MEYSRNVNVIPAVMHYYDYSLNTDEDAVLLAMFEFFDDLGLPDHIDQDAYESFQNKFFGFGRKEVDWDL